MYNKLLILALERVIAEIDGGADAEGVWNSADLALRLARPDDPELDDSDLAVIVELRDLDSLRELVGKWRANQQLPPSDKAVLKRAMNAIKKRLKVTRLDEESKLGGHGMTSGASSGIVAVRAPEQYPDEVWQELIRQGRVRDGGHGLLEVP